MASFFSKLFGRGGDSATPAKIAEETEAYNDLTFVAAPIPEGGQYRLAGRIEKRDGDRVLTRSFIRADLFSSRDDTVASTFRKAKQIADQHGASLFGDGIDSRQV
ncbi:transcriptional activator HlyU [Shinella sp. SUS2]|uniref:HlyU family transcriptional regulator n=1 Tax=unclassified Shinella TaxID=2643062 RepID=UPI00067FD931|nr:MULTISPECIES: HlyU family transcriptional regulator [unclassified Shinella]KNY18448.1 transcriptional activator HlyU [Shinella sp. SUS2]KOC77644.1 transcriptional activator HlyU [Shinella sp. GWS1]